MQLKKLSGYFSRMRGADRIHSRVTFGHIVWSGIGAFLGIYLITVMSGNLFMGETTSLFLVGSFGASAVLVYGVPQAELSQPRNLIGGHVLSAVVGVTIYRYLPLDVSLMAALAVSLSIVVMHLSATLHPPGGATALIAVIGGEHVHALGYLFVLTPIALGALILLLIALGINNISSNTNRHYPRHWW